MAGLNISSINNNIKCKYTKQSTQKLEIVILDKKQQKDLAVLCLQETYHKTKDNFNNTRM
jgi:hypothetical protein